jgi:hypothetical protein
LKTGRPSYRPASVIAGGATSVAALLAIIVRVTGVRRRRRIRSAGRRKRSETVQSSMDQT